MKTMALLTLSGSLLALGGCASKPVAEEVAVHYGMSCEALRIHFGEPLRIQSLPDGSQDWYYRFAGWKIEPTGTSETRDPYGESTTTGSLDISKATEERPIHVSPKGFVVGPLPKGKIVKN
jgi:hypothetical protein